MPFHPLPDLLLALLFALLLAMGMDFLSRLAAPFLRVWAAPGVWIARMIGWLRDKLNRAHRAESVLRMRGAVLTLFLLIVALSAGYALTWIGGCVRGGIFLEILVLARLFSAAPVLASSRTLRRLVLQESTAGAAERVANVLRRDALVGDTPALVRAMIEALAETVNANLLAPLLAYAIAGLPGALAVRLFALQAVRWRAASEPAGFADSARNVWSGLARLPTLLGGPCIVLAAALLPEARGFAAGGQWIRHALRSELILATFGAALATSLGGPRRHNPANPWWGGPSARPTAHHLRVAARLVWLTRGLVLVALALVWNFSWKN